MYQLNGWALPCHRIPDRGPGKPQAIVHLAHHRAVRVPQIHRLSAVTKSSTPRPKRPAPAELARDGCRILCDDEIGSALDTRRRRKKKIDAPGYLPPLKADYSFRGIVNLNELRRHRLVGLVVVNLIDNEGGHVELSQGDLCCGRSRREKNYGRPIAWVGG